MTRFFVPRIRAFRGRVIVGALLVCAYIFVAVEFAAGNAGGTIFLREFYAVCHPSEELPARTTW